MSGVIEALMYIFLFTTLYFEVFLLLAFLERGKGTDKGEDAPELTRYPHVSIIVPAFNEEQAVIDTIHSLLNLNYPKHKLSIIAVDDGSTDDTWQKLQAFSSHPMVTLLRKENGGKHTALNLGIKDCKSELIGCLDSDSTVHKDALRYIVREFLLNEKVDAVTPAMRIQSPRTILERVQAAEYTLGIFMRRTFSFMNTQIVTPGPFSLFRRSTFEKLGPYKKAHNTEDLEYALRIQASQGYIGNAPHALVYTPGKRTLSNLLNQRVRWTYGFLRNARDYKHLFFNKAYGDLSFFVLPSALLAIGSAITLAVLSLYTFGMNIAERIAQYYYGGFNFSFGINWFFINTDALIFVIVVVLTLTLSLMILGFALARDKVNPINIGAYFALYGLIAPLWLAQAVIRVLLKRESSWQQERS